MKLLKKATLALGLGLALQGAVQAQTLVTVWDYTYSSLFGTALPASVTNTGTVLSWGSLPQSSLTIQTPLLNLQATTNGPQADGTLLTHLNNPISGEPLTYAQLQSQIIFTPFSPAGLAQPAFNLNLDINFAETSNATPCASIGGPACNDIFVLTTPLPQTTSFLYDGWNYEVAFAPKFGLAPLTANECAAVAGAPLNCLGFITQEGASTDMEIGFTINATPVPEPGSLALLGLGLLGLVAARRRQQA